MGGLYGLHHLHTIVRCDHHVLWYLSYSNCFVVTAYIPSPHTFPSLNGSILGGLYGYAANAHYCTVRPPALHPACGAMFT